MFKVGDKVTYNNDAGHLILEYVQNQKSRVKLGARGIITEIHNKGEFYSVSWFDGTTSVHEELELDLCVGVSNLYLCNNCKYKTACRD